MDSEIQMFLNGLHGLGVPLVVIADPGRWVGICHDSADRYWIVEGKVTSSDHLKAHGVETTDHCYKTDYSAALEAFHEWWDRDFVGKPCGSACGKGFRPVR